MKISCRAKSIPTAKITRLRGFTLVELMVVIIVIGFLSYMIIPNIPFVKNWGEEKQMAGNAHHLNNAMGTFLADGSIRSALTAWRGKTAAERYQLLRPYMEHTPDTLEKMVLEGFIVTLPDDPRSGRVTVTKPDGTPLDY